jgi:hypothetical protein
MLSALLKRLARDVPRRLAIDWMTPAAIALAVVLGHSAWMHLWPTFELADYYVQALGSERWASVVGTVELVAALGLLFRATRRGACAMLISAILVAFAHKVASGRAQEGMVETLVVVAAAVAIALGEHARRARAVADVVEDER